jgi:hypothetical protein
MPDEPCSRPAARGCVRKQSRNVLGNGGNCPFRMRKGNRREIPAGCAKRALWTRPVSARSLNYRLISCILCTPRTRDAASAWVSRFSVNRQKMPSQFTTVPSDRLVLQGLPTGRSCWMRPPLHRDRHGIHQKAPALSRPETTLPGLIGPRGRPTRQDPGKPGGVPGFRGWRVSGWGSSGWPAPPRRTTRPRSRAGRRP